MSDFDKEAEREKLREQLEHEEEVREATQHMSDLLLKGATMTNKHCDECGDPVFRYQGQEFCPTCGREIAAADDGERASAGEGGATTDAAGVDADSGAPQTGTAPESTAGSVDTAHGAQPAGVESEDRTTGRGTSTNAAAPRDVAGDELGSARAALVRKLATLAREAEATDDVGRSRELLAAAREAAEALAAVDRVER